MIEITCDSCDCKNIDTLIEGMTWEYSVDGELHQYKYNLVSCKSCKMAFVNPTPSWEQIQTFYPDSYSPYQLNMQMVNEEAHSVKYKLARARYAELFQSSKKNKILSSLIRVVEILSGRIISYTLGAPLSLPKNARILELGYGSGYWLLAMKELGYKNLEGFDIDANKNRVSTLKDAGIGVTSGDFLDNNYDTNSYDLIRLEHVFEHLPYPLPVLNKITSLLKKDGILVMNFPSIESLSFKVSRANWYNLQTPKHLFFPSRKSTLKYIEKAGLEIVNMRLYGCPNVMGATLNNVMDKKYKIGKAFPDFLVNILGPIYTLISKIAGKGDSITIIAKKSKW
jgi:SAM-dependent methyltransferase